MEPSMSSRAALLLQRELHRLQTSEKTWGVELSIVKNDIFHWSGLIEGLPDTPWEGGLFKVEMFFDEEYNEKPPDIYFMTVPFHPNVDMHTGRPCVSFLEDSDEWDPETPLSSILLFLQSLLADPGLDRPVNSAAAEIYLSSRKLYDQLVRDCVVASRRIHSGLAPFHEEECIVQQSDDTELRLIKPTAIEPVSMRTNIQTISYDNYYEFWKSAATSIPGNTTNIRVSRIPGELLLTEQANLSSSQYREIMQRQRDLWFGKFKQKIVKKSAEKRTSRDERIEAMRRIYSLPTPTTWKSDGDEANVATGIQQNSFLVAPSSRLEAVVSVGDPHRIPDKRSVSIDESHKREEWEQEADDLLDWTARLLPLPENDASYGKALDHP